MSMVGPAGRAVPVARRFALRSRSRFAIAATVCSVVVMLIVAEIAIMSGLERTSSWVMRTGGDLFVTEAGAKPLGAGVTSVPAGAAEQIASISGVAEVVDLHGSGFSLQIPGDTDEVSTILTAWEPGALDLPLERGRLPAAAGDLVVDEGFARARGLELESSLSIRGWGGEVSPARVVGTTRDVSLVIFQNVFTVPATLAELRPASDSDRETAESASQALDDFVQELNAGAQRLRTVAAEIGLFSASEASVLAAADGLEAIAEEAVDGKATIDDLKMIFETRPPESLAIKLAPSADPAIVVQRLRDVPGIDVYLPDEYREAVEAGSVGPFLPVLLAVVAIAVLVGTLVLRMTLSTMVSESVVDYAVLRSLGRTRRALRRTVLGQGAYLIGTSLVAGTVVGTAVVLAVRRIMPLLPSALSLRVYVIAAVAAVSMLVLGSLLPMRRVLRVDPVRVFRV